MLMCGINRRELKSGGSRTTPEIPVSCDSDSQCSLMLTMRLTTVNLKEVELPVKQIVSGKIIKPSGTLLRFLGYYKSI